ncbi:MULTISPECIES: MarR family winged helix-turn-helix transcriptional regulator [Streptomyces]|uniref:MarR family winged helix-turn-helix transcriptional regulator n=1 Tax=Streptomyces fuscus TaxID=3048495 RepID=A0ABT7IRT0_9ACTN|nr:MULTISPECIES: MarR family winged helix-turn-helix transcriptional regulator [Streptomyces]MCM1975983.1 MarR family winged helix-turn-helix transcriptional regulator [Streptomyces sp. G1]MDL2074819.1 MarR family winged helix-turn-helix transcriptional regulator [Streptomyces fuscus]SBT91111.1 DNA-binding transcriptional regulator, MarR family [Streptomyces sp. DI166]
MSEPGQRLYFLLQRAAHQLRTAADRRCLAAAGITTAQLGALFAVEDRPGVTQQQLARTLGLRESAVTGLVARLTAAGLLARSAHPTEHRAVVLELTEAGSAALDAARPEIDRFNAELRALLGDDGFDRTAAALHRIVHGGE